MIRFILSALTLTALFGVVAVAQPMDPNRIKGCARTMTNDMRNCGGGQQPDLKNKAKQAGESAQGRAEEETSCNQWALYAYFSCIYDGGYGVVKPVVPVATGDVAPKSAKTTVKPTLAPQSVTPKLKN